MVTPVNPYVVDPHPRIEIAAVRVIKQGQYKPGIDQSRERCAKFRLSDEAALRWFKRSKEVSKHVWLEQLDWTQCSASGTLTTKAGHSYAWDLDESGRGYIRLNRNQAVYLAGKELPFAKE